jgi:hypothetical protein
MRTNLIALNNDGQNLNQCSSMSTRRPLTRPDLEGNFACSGTGGLVLYFFCLFMIYLTTLGSDAQGSGRGLI